MTVEPSVTLSGFAEVISILTVANFALGFENVRDYIGGDWKDRTTKLANTLSDQVELIKARGVAPHNLSKEKLGQLMTQFSQEYEPIVVRQTKTEAALNYIQKNCFYVLSMFGMVLLILGAYEQHIGPKQVSITLFHLSSIVLVIIASLSLIMPWKKFKDAHVKSSVMNGYAILGVLLFVTNGGVSYCKEFMCNPLCSIPFACLVLSLGFFVFIIRSMSGKRFFKASQKVFDRANAPLMKIHAAIDTIDSFRK